MTSLLISLLILLTLMVSLLISLLKAGKYFVSEAQRNLSLLYFFLSVVLYSDENFNTILPRGRDEVEVVLISFLLGLRCEV